VPLRHPVRAGKPDDVAPLKSLAHRAEGTMAGATGLRLVPAR
jgi:hypothetical protein